LDTLIHRIEGSGSWAPWIFLGIFLAASVLVIWRLEAMSDKGFEGTVLGTLVMPYCTGMGNLIFAFIIARKGGPGGEVLTNNLVNNVTDMTLVLGLPAMIWGIRLIPAKSKKAPEKKAKGKTRAVNIHELNRLSLMLTLTAVLFFTGATWVLGRNGKLDFTAGVILVDLFLFWQSFHVYEVLRNKVQENKTFGWMLWVDIALLGVGAYATYVSTDWLVDWVSNRHIGFVTARHMGWLSGWLMVVPNAVLAFYYGWQGEPEVVYSSQVGDCHVSIPLCIGIYALYHPMTLPPYFLVGVAILGSATVLHLLFVTLLGRLPRFFGVLLITAYGYFLYRGLIQ
jgi:cation:H+ antiporter